jgi:hypothetical protein
MNDVKQEMVTGWVALWCPITGSRGRHSIVPVAVQLYGTLLIRINLN